MASQEFLAKRRWPVGEQVDAKKVRFGRAEALKFARTAERVVSIRGASVVSLNMKHQPPDDDTLAKAVLGPTGNLRAPAFRMGKSLIVGFNEQVFTANVE